MITLTKIKRIAARYGIGDPLNGLMYDTKEIRAMRLNASLLNKPTKARCLIDGCKRELSTRGLCVNHYTAMS
ncbi:hypothetical protein LCGC14_2329800, partial [marine sediment metagenome]